LPGRIKERKSLPGWLPPATRDFHEELRRRVDQAGFSTRTLQAVTSEGQPGFRTSSSWNRWLNAEKPGPHPPRDAIERLVEKLGEKQNTADHLLELWDAAFAPARPSAQPEGVPQSPVAPQPPGPQTPPPLPSAQQAEPGGGRTNQAASYLADIVARECATELTDRVLAGQEPLVVNWRPHAEPDGDPAAASPVPAGGTGDIGPLVCHAGCGRWLVVLGPDGAGKTTLALLLMECLIARRTAADPVPVLLTATSLKPGEMIGNWISRILADRYPALRDTRAYGPDAAGDLVTRRRVVPVIDGLDDLDPGSRAGLLSALQRALGRYQSLILTSRPQEYHQAVAGAGRVPLGMAVIELQPVAAADTATFLERGAAGPDACGWRLVATEIRSQPDGPLARALASPLMAGLIRSAYAGRAEAAAALAAHGEAATIEDQILDALVTTRFGERATSQNRRPRRPVNPADADRWLAFLARHLAHHRTYELDWQRLRHALPAFGTPLRWAALAGTLAWLLAGAAFGASRGLAAGAMAGAGAGFWQGIDAALIVGSIYLLAPLSYPAGTAVAPWLQWLRQHASTPLRTAVIVPVAYALESGLRDGITAAGHDSIARSIRLGLTAMALNWLVATAVLGIATRARLVDQAENPLYFSLRVPGRGTGLTRTVAAGVLWGTGLGLVAGYGVNVLSSALAHEHPLWFLGIPVGAVLGAAFALVQWGRAPVQSAPAASPASVLRADRNLVLLLAMAFLVLVPAFYAAAFATASDPRAIAQFGLYGLGIGLVIWLAIALSHVWPQYLITTAWLAAHGRIPWRLASFLSEARDLQILRQRGSTYEFRHARLQDHLASRPTQDHQ
jgi:hypothetical protein